MEEWRCKNEKCNKKLGDIIYDGLIKILGPNGQDYEINFCSICVICNECGEKNILTSVITDIPNQIRDFGDISNTAEQAMHMDINFLKPLELASYNKKLLLKELSITEKNVYELLIKDFDLYFNFLGIEEIKKISEKINLPQNITIETIKNIIKKMEKFKGKDIAEEVFDREFLINYYYGVKIKYF